MPQSHDTLSGHGLIRGGSAQLGFLLGEFDAEAFRSERFRSCDEWIFEVNFRQAGLSATSSMSPMRRDVKRKFLSMLSWEDGVECIQPSLCSGETLSLRVLRADQAVVSLYSTGSLRDDV